MTRVGKPTTIEEVLRDLQMVTHDNGYDTFDRVKALDATEQLILTEVVLCHIPVGVDFRCAKLLAENQRQALSNLMRGGGES